MNDLRYRSVLQTGVLKSLIFKYLIFANLQTCRLKILTINLHQVFRQLVAYLFSSRKVILSYLSEVYCLIKVETGLISLEKKLSESETLNVKVKNTQLRYEEDNERLKEEIAEQKSKIGSLQQENKKLDGEASEQKRSATKLSIDFEKLTQDIKLKAKEVEALKR